MSARAYDEQLRVEKEQEKEGEGAEDDPVYDNASASES